MTFWVFLWKFVFIATILVYGVMAVWVTIQGAFDIKSLFATLRERHERADEPTPEQ